ARQYALIVLTSSAVSSARASEGCSVWVKAIAVLLGEEVPRRGGARDSQNLSMLRGRNECAPSSHCGLSSQRESLCCGTMSATHCGRNDARHDRACGVRHS